MFGVWAGMGGFPNKMNRKRRGRSACPFCSHERPSYFFNAALMYPEMVFYWDPELNGENPWRTILQNPNMSPAGNANKDTSGSAPSRNRRVLWNGSAVILLRKWRICVLTAAIKGFPPTIIWSNISPTWQNSGATAKMAP